MKQYFAYKTTVMDKLSYSILPLSADCAYLDGLFYPDQKMMVLMAKHAVDRFQMVTRVNDFGEPLKDKMSNKERQDRIRVSLNHEYYLKDIEDIRWFFLENTVNGKDVVKFIDSLQKTDDIKNNT